jgi:GT2 family glycosyltransferase
MSLEMDKPIVSVVIISVGRQSLYDLVPAVLDQEADFDFEVLIIANGPVRPGDLPREGVRVHSEAPGKGIPYYRNSGARLARGRVIAYVDDDVILRDRFWLARLAGPILSGDEKVTVAGAFIPQGQGFLADLISLLGYPGGGSLGWRNVWEVDRFGHTDKLCTCNCAIDRAALDSAGGFHEDLALGASDLYLGESLMDKGLKILLVDEATVEHEARGDISGFIRWQVNRGKSIYDLRHLRPLGEFSRNHVTGRVKRTCLIIRRTFPGRQFLPMLGILLLEFGCHAVGYALRAIEKRGTKALRRGPDPD